MSKYLWQSDEQGQVDKTIMDFMAGEDVVLDRELFPFDIQATVFLTERAGKLGARVHTGRSRNDQVAVATRLFMKDCLHQWAVDGWLRRGIYR
jgi:argininosuccinate lyase